MVKSSCPEVLIKTFKGRFPGKFLFISFNKLSFQTFIEVKPKFNKYFLWEFEQIWIKPNTLQSNTLCNQKL